MANKKNSEDLPIELRKPVEMIHMSGRLTLLQKKLVNNLVYHAFHELLDQEIHKINIMKLAEDAGFDSRNTAFLKSSLRDIVNTTCEFNLLRNGSEIWQASALLAEATIVNGEITYSFPPRLRKMLHDPKVFSIVNLQIQKLFSSGYAFSLYENCHRFKNVGSTGFWDLDVFKKMMGIDPKEDTVYKEFKYLNNQIIKPAMKEVNKVTDIHLEIELKKKGKSVVEIRFDVTHHENKDFNSDDQQKVTLLSRMINLGISEKTARSYITKHPLDFIEGNLAEVEYRIKTQPGKIKNYPAFFKKALEEDFRKVTPPIDKKAEELKKHIEEQARAAHEEEIELTRQSKQRRADARQYFDGIDKKAQVAVEKKFASFIEKTNAFAFKSYAKSGLKGLMVGQAFDDWLANELDRGTIFNHN